MAKEQAGERTADQGHTTPQQLTVEGMQYEDSDEISPAPTEGDQRSARDERRALITEYQLEFSCRVLVFAGEITSDSPLLFEQLLRRIPSGLDIHLLISTDGGDPEAAIRLVRLVQSRCCRLTIIVPHQAKSAGTLLVLGAHEIVMGPTSDLGPVDPQIWLKHYGRMPAKAVVAAFQHAEREATGNDEAALFYALTLANRSAVDAQQGRDALAHTSVQLKQALGGHPNRTVNETEQLALNLEPLLIAEPQSHAATISAQEMQSAGLPIVELEPLDTQWSQIWELWTRYTEVTESQIYESTDIAYLFHLDPTE